MGVVSMVSAAVVSLLLWFAGVAADASDHRYKINDPVPLYANKVGPFHNPRLGFCSSCSLVSDLSLCFQDLFDLCVFFCAFDPLEMEETMDALLGVFSSCCWNGWIVLFSWFLMCLVSYLRFEFGQ